MYLLCEHSLDASALCSGHSEESCTRNLGMFFLVLETFHDRHGKSTPVPQISGFPPTLRTL